MGAHRSEFVWLEPDRAVWQPRCYWPKPVWKSLYWSACRTSVVVPRRTPMTAFILDVGPTFFFYPSVLREIFAAVGHDLDSEVKMVKLDPQYRAHLRGRRGLLATPDLARMEQAIALVSDHAIGFRRFYADNKRKLQSFKPFLESPFLSWRDLCKPEMAKLLPLLRPWSSLQSDLGAISKIRGCSWRSRFNRSTWGCPRFAALVCFRFCSFLEYEYGVFHPIGGCGA